MNYEELLQALERDDDEEFVELLEEKVLKPCLDGDLDCDVEWNIDDSMDVEPGFIKPELLSVYQFAVVRRDDLRYRIHVRAHYIDTVSIDSDGAFGKTDVVIAMEGEITPNSSEYEANVHTKVGDHI